MSSAIAGSFFHRHGGRVFTALLFVLFIACIPRHSDTPVKKGRVSLTHPAYAGQAIRVNGEWEFYPFVFLDPKDVLNRPAPGSYPTVPSSWNTYLSDAGDGIGYGSYRLVAAVSPGRAYGIYGGEMGVATSIYIDGHLIARSGRPSESATQEVPETLPMEGTFIPQGDTSEVIIHISNFDYRKGGFWNALYLGDAESIRRFVRMQRFRDMFLAGAFLISAFYHLILFLVIRRDRVLPLFSLLSLIITFRLLGTNQRLLVDLFPVLHFPAYFRIEIGSWLLAMPVGLHFVYCLFPRHIPRRIHQFAYL
ncbi:MAG: hypothetical protein KDK27_17765, partial [Leptospiraceae bacterium]|nr:hypothetical protein [Leptospiraceae bacterium]